MTDHVKLYTKMTTRATDGLHIHEATPAEILAHPAVVALVAERDRLRAVYLTAAAVWAASADECGIAHDTDEMDALAAALTDYEQAATRAAKETPNV